MRAIAIARRDQINRVGRSAGLLILTMLIVMLWAGIAAAAPKAELWERWTAHDPASSKSVDHSIWDALTRRHVSRRSDGVAIVGYDRFSSADKASLNTYLTAMASTPVSKLNRDEQMAYWLNLYNALTVKVILDHFPVDSIRDIDISPGFFSNGPWGAKLIVVEGTELSLDDIEHRILRPIWKDPRIHYGVNCASIGCPDLKFGAYTAERLNADLDAAARIYINHPRGVTVDRGRLVVSSIYEWFQEDFGGNDAGVIAHLKKYAAPSLRSELSRVDSIYDDEYDWSLNDPSAPISTSSRVRSLRSLAGPRGGS